VYLLHGEEDLLIDQALAALLDRLVPPEERDLNVDVLRAGEIAITDLITRLDTLPFFGRRRVVVVKDAAAWKPSEQERLAAYLEQGPPPSAFILVAQGLDRRRKLYTTIRRIGEAQEFPRCRCGTSRPGLPSGRGNPAAGWTLTPWTPSLRSSEGGCGR